MRYQGKITDWKDDRGFGFITPSSGGAPVFVHISAFDKGQRRPIGKELVSYELFNDPHKGVHAHKVRFLGAAVQPSPQPRRRLSLRPFMAVLIAAGIGLYVWQHSSSNRAEIAPPVESPDAVEETTQFTCQGKRHCSEMTSCAEATYYLKNCPDVEIDGDADGIPCESQWCGH